VCGGGGAAGVVIVVVIGNVAMFVVCGLFLEGGKGVAEGRARARGSARAWGWQPDSKPILAFLVLLALLHKTTARRLAQHTTKRRPHESRGASPASYATSSFDIDAFYLTELQDQDLLI
jgi:hypothetical protein